MMTKPLCIYHGNCADGFGAAWAVREFCGGGKNVDFHAGVYQDPPPDVTGRDVLMVDFSYKRPVLDEMAEAANSILIIDHHKSAAEDLADIPEPPSDRMWEPGIHAVFDMERSGAGLTWDHLMGTVRPGLIDHIEDRDLWKFKLQDTRKIQAAVFSYPYDFVVWDELMNTALITLAEQGEAIERKHHKDVAELVGVTMRHMTIAGYYVPVANLPYTLTSDAGHLMCEPSYIGESVPPFAACYWDTPEGRVFSLRSVDEYGGMDVSEIAKQYGGGGHKHAAGFRVPFDHELGTG